MKKQSSRARAQSSPPVRHQLEHEVPTVIHDPEEDMTALGRWAHHAMLDPRRYLTLPALIIGGAILLVLVLRLATTGASNENALWNRLEAAKTPAERADIAKTDPKSPAATWAMLLSATEFFNQALSEMPADRDAALQTSKKALNLFEEIARSAPHDAPQARVAALGKARVLEMRNELSQAIEQYQLVAKEWPGTPEAVEAARYAEALKDPKAVDFYKELFAYTPPRVDLPPEGTQTLSVPGAGTGSTAPSSPSPEAAEATRPTGTPPLLSPDLGAIPGMREVIEPSRVTPAPAAGSKTEKPAAPPAKPAEPARETRLPDRPFAPGTSEAKPADTPKDKGALPDNVFSPKDNGSKPR